MDIYLAGRYSRREELAGYAAELREAGHTVTSRWLDGNHQISRDGKPIGDDGEALIEGNDDSPEAVQMRWDFAAEDLEDIDGADMLIAFTEPPRSDASRGGRHVEMGYAIGTGKIILVVGYRENLFCWLPTMYFARNWTDARSRLILAGS